MRSYVLDTSVLVKWYNEEDELHVVQAKQIRSAFKKGNLTLIVPDLVFVELLNVFIKGKHFSQQETVEMMHNVFSLPLVVKESSQSLLIAASEVARSSGMTAYDAVFVALARQEECQLISDDTRSHAHVKDGTVLMLETYPH